MISLPVQEILELLLECLDSSWYKGWQPWYLEFPLLYDLLQELRVSILKNIFYLGGFHEHDFRESSKSVKWVITYLYSFVNELAVSPDVFIILFHATSKLVIEQHWFAIA